MINLYVHIVMYKNCKMYNCGVFVVYFFNFFKCFKVQLFIILMSF